MPDDMLEAAKGFGVDLPLPDLGGGEGSGIGGILDAVIGGGSSEPSENMARSEYCESAISNRGFS